MTSSDIGKLWDELHEICWEINELEEERRRMYRDRCRAISERAISHGTFSMLHEGADDFRFKLATIKRKLEDLWLQKRTLLSRLSSSSEWSWMGPTIPRSRPSSEVSPMHSELRMVA